MASARPMAPERLVDVRQVRAQVILELALRVDELDCGWCVNASPSCWIERREEAHVVAVGEFALLEHGADLALEPTAQVRGRALRRSGGRDVHAAAEGDTRRSRGSRVFLSPKWYRTAELFPCPATAPICRSDAAVDAVIGDQPLAGEHDLLLGGPSSRRHRGI